MSTGGRAPRKLTKEEEEERKETCKRLAKERDQRMIIEHQAWKAKREENLRKRHTTGCCEGCDQPKTPSPIA